MLRQLLLAFGFFGLVLVLVYWINRAVFLFDQLIANGESLAVFVELSVLTLPLMVLIVLPIAAFAATVFVTNRLSAENELVVAQSAGFGPFRMARPVFLFGLLAGGFSLVLAHVLVPMSQQRLAERQAQIAQNISARFLTEGSFVHPADGITIYIREITRDGEMLDIFLSDQRDPARQFVYSAERALLVHSEEGPRLVMFKGLVQILENTDERLTITAFDDFTYNLSALTEGGFLDKRSYYVLSTPDLLRAAPVLLAETGESPGVFLSEAHARTTRALMSLVAPLVGFGTLLLGGFSRFGLWRQIFVAILLLAGLKFLENAAEQAAWGQVDKLWLLYLPALVGLAVAWFTLWLSPRLVLWPRRSGRADGAVGEVAP